MSKSKDFTLIEIRDDYEVEKQITYPLIAKVGACFIYGLTSAGLTFVNKTLYEKFSFSSPLDVNLFYIFIFYLLMCSYSFCYHNVCAIY